MIHGQRTIYVLLLSSLVTGLAVFACSSEEASLPEIRGHVQNIDGVPHANGFEHGERYCQLCHGAGLAGGEGLEPSCYQCHGKNWLDDDPEFSWALTDHTEDFGGYRHQPLATEPSSTCVACHGTDLQGDSQATSSYPGCYSCHGPIWELSSAE